MRIMKKNGKILKAEKMSKRKRYLMRKKKPSRRTLKEN
jgi:hypothetical protein